MSNGDAQGQDTEQREEFRLDNEKAVVFVEIKAENLEEGEAAERVLCKLLDVSANGIRIRIDRSLDEGAIFPVVAYFGRGHTPLSLVGEVRWVREDGHFFQIGFSIFESALTDIEKWKSLIAAKL